MDSQDLPDPLDPSDLHRSELLDLKEPPVLLDPLETMVSKDPPDLLEFKESLDPKALSDPQVLPDQRVKRVIKE